LSGMAHSRPNLSALLIFPKNKKTLLCQQCPQLVTGCLIINLGPLALRHIFSNALPIFCFIIYPFSEICQYFCSFYPCISQIFSIFSSLCTNPVGELFSVYLPVIYLHSLFSCYFKLCSIIKLYLQS
jgi:hypothetical protein